jgi:hypothetical protein
MKLVKIFSKVLMCMLSSLALHGAKMDERRALSVCGRDSHGGLVIKVIDGREMPLIVLVSRSFWESNSVAMASARERMRRQRLKLHTAELSSEERAVIKTIVKNYFEDEETDLQCATDAVRATLDVDTIAQSPQ